MWSKNNKIITVPFTFLLPPLNVTAKIVRKMLHIYGVTLLDRGGKQGDLPLCIGIVGIMILQAMPIYKELSLISLLPLVMIIANASDEHNYQLKLSGLYFMQSEYDLKWSKWNISKMRDRRNLHWKAKDHTHLLTEKKIKLQKLLSAILLLKMILPLLVPSSQAFVMPQNTAVKKGRWSWINHTEDQKLIKELNVLQTQWWNLSAYAYNRQLAPEFLKIPGRNLNWLHLVQWPNRFVKSVFQVNIKL